MRTTLARLMLGAAFIVNATSAYAADAPAADAAAEDKIAEGSTIVVTATKANEIAPVTASLATTQPQSIISRSFIQDSISTTADFNQIALIAPSVSNFGGTNGVGLSESKAQIRGFQDGEYNITYDGVPFGDQNDPTHHSNTFWPSNTIETLVVDRGSGNASQLGQATFGGNINLFSRAPRDEMSAEFVAGYGSFNTINGQAVLQSGAIDALGGTKFVVSAQYVNSDGALSFEKYKQLNLYAKAVVPISNDVTLSFVATANRNVFAQSDNDGASAAQVLAFGKRYALSNDPNTQNYFGYNSTIKTTDFYIARLDAKIAPNSEFTNSAYTYKYDNETLSGLDATQPGLLAGQVPGVAVPTGVTTTNRVKLSSTGAFVFGVPGYTKSNAYRVYGDIAKVKVDFGFGALTVGAWLEWSHTYRQQTEIDLISNRFNYRNSQQVAPATGLNPGAITQGYIRFDQNSSLNHTEEFAELELRPFDGLTITPGIKHIDFNRKIDALYNQTTRYAQRISKTYTATVPFLTANYQITSNLSIYGQYAKGFLAPPLSQLYVARPDLSAVDPQTSTNYQAGIVYHGSKLSLDFDAYSIDFNNKFVSSTSPVPGEGTIFTNIGGALFRGIEGQATFAFGNGFAVFANASLNEAIAKDTRLQIDKAPESTAAAGILYKHGPIRFSLIDKYTGPQFITNTGLGATIIELTPVAGIAGRFRIAPYNTALVSASYDFGFVRAGIKVSDLFDSQRVINVSGTQYFFQPGRQITGEVTVKF
jgi:iron complex outermembrane receptor protein